MNTAGTEISGWWTLDGESVPGKVRRADYSLERAKEAEPATVSLELQQQIERATSPSSSTGASRLL